MTAITTYYLEMNSPSRLGGKPVPAGFRIRAGRPEDYRMNRDLYRRVGADWGWRDRLAWTDGDWRNYCADECLLTRILYSGESPAGYYELLRQDGGNVEIAYFGLLPAFTGRGLGGCLLAHALETAWRWPGTQRVWVHTCSLDHPSALRNYQARGLEIFRVEVSSHGGMPATS